MQPAEIFDKFKKQYPNSREEYLPTPANISRWNWHLQNPPQKLTGKNIAPNIDALEIAKRRRFDSFRDMPEYMKEKYLEIASFFPGRQIWACGSRVNGQYIESDGDFLDSAFSVRWMREKLNKAEKKVSDYDFYIALEPGENRAEIMMPLPSWADLLPHGVPDNEKILIPMWDFEKLPKSEHGRVLEAFRLNRTVELMQIHNKYQLSPTSYCCNSKPVMKWFGWAIEQGIIKQDEHKEQN